MKEDVLVNEALGVIVQRLVHQRIRNRTVLYISGSGLGKGQSMEKTHPCVHDCNAELEMFSDSANAMSSSG